MIQSGSSPDTKNGEQQPKGSELWTLVVAYDRRSPMRLRHHTQRVSEVG